MASPCPCLLEGALVYAQLGHIKVCQRTTAQESLPLQVGRAHPVRATWELLSCADLTAALLRSSQDEASSEPRQAQSSTPRISLAVVVSEGICQRCTLSCVLAHKLYDSVMRTVHMMLYKVFSVLEKLKYLRDGLEGLNI